MSESQEYEEITVSRDGVAVTKTFEEDSFPVPAIAFRVESERTESVSVRLVDDVPDTVAVEDLGFHPEYGSEYWTIEDDKITFEREIDAGEEFTTVYGIRAAGTDDIDQFLTEPELTKVDPPRDDGTDVVGSANSDVVRDVISGDSDTVPGLDEEDEDADEAETETETEPETETVTESDTETEEEEQDIETIDLAEPDEDAETEADAVPDSEGGQVDAAGSDGAADLDDDADPDDESDAEAPSGVESGQPEPDATDGVESVASALADEIREGTVEDDDLELLREELDVGGTDGTVDARIGRLQDDVSDFRAYIDALEEFLEENGTGKQLLEDIQARMDDIQSDIEENNERVADVERLETEVESLGDAVSSVEDDVESLKSDLGEIEDVEGWIEDLDQEISDLKEWREQLTSVLGATDD